MDTKEAPTTPAVETPAAVQANPKPKRQIKTGDKGATKPAPAKADAKPAVKPKPVKADAPKEPKTLVNEHVVAGLDVDLYPGLSKFVNANRKVKIMTGVSRDTGSLTDRMKAGLYALRKAYSGRGWKARGFDNGILGELAGAGLIEFSGGIVEKTDGHDYLMDGAQPVVGKITAKGMKYGIA